MSKTCITVAYGDGIGPEIMEATLKILEAAGAQLEIEKIDIGEKVYLSGNNTGIPQSAWDSLRKTKVFLKSPITTPQGGGYKSLNVTTRKTLGLYANVRPCVSYHPFVRTKHPVMDVVIIRENEEDLYSGIEYRQSQDVIQCLKIISRQGCEKIIRYAFEYAVNNGRKKVTCFSKDNIMKMTDGLFHKTFDQIAKEYPNIQTDHLIVDIGAARLADTPERFDVIVTENLYGDILSDIAAQITGSVGLGGSVNLGETCGMFEAIHGSAPDIAGQDVANPSGLLLGAIMMLVHIGQPKVAEKVHNAWLKTIEDGTHTPDIYNKEVSKQKVGCKAFTQAVIDNLGQKPKIVTPVTYPEIKRVDKKVVLSTPKIEEKTWVGTDLFFAWCNGSPDQFAKEIEACTTPALKLKMISNRGVKVWPNGHPETFCVDNWRCRFEFDSKLSVSEKHKEFISIQERLYKAGLEVGKSENLYNFDGKAGYSSDQGE